MQLRPSGPVVKLTRLLVYAASNPLTQGAATRTGVFRSHLHHGEEGALLWMKLRGPCVGANDTVVAVCG